MIDLSFSDIAVVSCGTMSLELASLPKSGFLNTPHILYTTPGLHQDVPELERQLVRQIRKGLERAYKVIAKAHAVMENFSPGSSEIHLRLGLRHRIPYHTPRDPGGRACLNA
jgi:hypothetical protein